MNEERLKILEMVSQGKISSEEGVRLLEALDSDRDAEAEAEAVAAAGRTENTAINAYNADSQKNRPTGGTGSQGSMLRVRIVDSDGSKVNVNVPLGLLKSLGKLTSLVPREVNEKLNKQGIDLSSLDIEGILEAMSSGASDGHLVDIDDADGDKVTIFID